MNTPVVSVIIPVYNVRDYVEQCLASVRAQKLDGVEMILVDDGSTDGSGRIIDRYAGTPGIKVIHKPNQGLGMARNTGLEHAEGKWVCFLDADDQLNADTLSRCVSLADEHDADEVRFMFKRFRHDANADADAALVNAACSGQVYVSDTDPASRFDPLLHAMVPEWRGAAYTTPSTQSACSAIYRRSVIEKHNLRFHSERKLISEDIIFNIDFARVCGRIVFTTYQYYNYRITPQSLTTRFQPDRIDRSATFCRFLERHLDRAGVKNAREIAAGAMMGYLRTHNRHIFASDLTPADKRRYFIRAAQNPYVREICGSHLCSRFGLLPRIAFTLHTSGHYRLSRLLTSLRDTLHSRGV